MSATMLLVRRVLLGSLNPLQSLSVRQRHKWMNVGCKASVSTAMSPIIHISARSYYGSKESTREIVMRRLLLTLLDQKFLSMLSGTHDAQTMQVMSEISTQAVRILIISGSAHCFLDNELALRLGIPFSVHTGLWWWRPTAANFSAWELLTVLCYCLGRFSMWIFFVASWLLRGPVLAVK